MALSLIQQIHQLLAEKKHILITFRQDATGDAIASAAALSLWLTKQGKPVDIIGEGFKLPKQFEFLKGASAIKSAVSHLQKFIITLDVKETGVEELSYDLKDEKLRVFVTPKKGFLNRDHVRTAQSDFKYDLIFVLDTPDLEQLGGLYDNNTELFYKTSIINIDHEPGNERFGQMNIVELTVASTAEIVFDLMQKLGAEYITADVATALLAGLIAKTRSFKSASVKPHTLATASKLMSLGADRELIVTNLYRTRSVSALQLWGHALTHMQSDKNLGLVWSLITRDDFVRCGATETDLKDIIDELISTSPEAKITLLLHEHTATHQTIHGLLRADKEYDARLLVKSLMPAGNKQDVSFTVAGKELKAVSEAAIEEIKRALIK